MISASRCLIGTHDFKSFAASDHQSTSTTRTIQNIQFDVPLEGQVVILITGTGFLKQMVRNIVGSLIEIGTGRKEPDWLGDVLRTKLRSAAGPTAPARGLTLLRSEVNWPT